MKEKMFNSAKDMIVWLMDNEGFYLEDSYGRMWTYSKFEFYFRDIGKNVKFEKHLKCLHLYGTNMKINKS